jgi:hypothetical protein
MPTRDRPHALALLHRYRVGREPELGEFVGLTQVPTALVVTRGRAQQLKKLRAGIVN